MSLALNAALGASICWGTAWFFSARVSRQAGSLNALFLFQLLGIPLLLVVFPVRPEIEGAPQWGAFLGLAALCCGCMGLFFQAMRVGNLALVTPISQTAPVVTALLGVLVLREHITALQTAAVGLVLVGVTLLSIARSQGATRLMAGVPQAITAAVVAGVYLFLCASVARTSGWYWTALGLRLGMVLWLSMLVIPRWRRWCRSFPTRFWRDAALAALLDVTAFSLFNFAVGQAEVWYVAAIVSTQSLVTVVLAAMFLRERLSIRQWIGLTLVLLGLAGFQTGIAEILRRLV